VQHAHQQQPARFHLAYTWGCYELDDSQLQEEDHPWHQQGPVDLVGPVDLNGFGDLDEVALAERSRNLLASAGSQDEVHPEQGRDNHVEPWVGKP
jgi:hypothetical protein